jgi:hypothetical protein
VIVVVDSSALITLALRDQSGAVDRLANVV